MGRNLSQKWYLWAAICFNQLGWEETNGERRMERGGESYFSSLQTNKQNMKMATKCMYVKSKTVSQKWNSLRVLYLTKHTVEITLILFFILHLGWILTLRKKRQNAIEQVRDVNYIVYFVMIEKSICNHSYSLFVIMSFMSPNKVFHQRSHRAFPLGRTRCPQSPSVL